MKQHKMKLLVWMTVILELLVHSSAQCQQNQPIDLVVIGLSHGHVNQILKRPDKGDIKIAGIVESNTELARRYSVRYGFSMNMVFTTIEEMLASVNPVAVAGFGPTYEHLEIVQKCAPLGIHVMVEKPLAVSYDHAKKMEALALKHQIHLLTNYETTWYPTNHKAYEMIEDGAVGKIRKVVVHDGHRGPAEIGVGSEFLEWLTDPVANGGGAVTDFGCYGANLITWLVNGEEPISVFGALQTFKPELYPEVDDEATIVLKYPDMQGIIQASWNWPFSRKDMEVYGRKGYVLSHNKYNISYRLHDNDKVEAKETLQDLGSPYNDPFAFFAALINNEIVLQPFDPSSLENNMIVVKILDAAKKSASEGKEIKLNQHY